MKIEEKVYNSLKQYGRMATYKIAALNGISHTQAWIVLEDLFLANVILKEVETNAVYWRVKDES